MRVVRSMVYLVTLPKQVRQWNDVKRAGSVDCEPRTDGGEEVSKYLYVLYGIECCRVRAGIGQSTY